MELGVILVLFSAFLSTLRETARKHVSRDFSSIKIGVMGQVYGILLLLPFAYWRYTKVGLEMTPELFAAVLVSGGVVVATTYIYVEAMRISDISMTEPLRKTTPIFVAVLEPLILGVNFQLTVLLGALVGTAGAYIMVSKNSLLEPLESLKNKGAMMSLLVALIFAFWALAQRFGATNTDPLLFIYMTYIAGFTGFWAWDRRESGSVGFRDYLRKDVFALGTITALSAVVGVFAYSMISASEVTVIKQTSAIFGVLIGRRFFMEEDIFRKLVGAVVIIAGAALVVL